MLYCCEEMNLKGIESEKNILLQMSQKSRMKGVLAQLVHIFSFLVKSFPFQKL